MKLQGFIKEFDALPNSFVLEDGTRFESTTMLHSDGVWYAYLYQMKGTIREHLFCYRTGSTESEAIENLKINLILIGS
jgi:hypothetical protein